MSDLHQDFLDAEADHQFAGPLRQLASTLRKLSWKAQGEWVWYMVPRGAMVAMRVNPTTFRKELRIARREISTKSVDRWHLEVATFLDHLDCKHWVCVRDAFEGDGEKVKAWVLYEEPAPSKPKCAECGKECEPSPTFKQHICNQCAVKLGNQEIAGKESA